MNYRHIYHAGNFADVMKHLAMVLMLEHLKKKDAPFFVLDAHGGIGLYDLRSIEALKTQEFAAGIGRFANQKDMPDDFRTYYDLVKDDLAQRRYPGSPMIAARMLRQQDSGIVNELHPVDVETLKANMRGHKSTKITHLDAYECIRAHIPPKEKRGVILIDPPFEKTDEFETLIRQMKEWKKRFATGIFAIWYPIKAHLKVDDMLGAAAALGLPRTWVFETLLLPRNTPETFNGCGLVIFNAPYQIPERIEKLFPYLKTQMNLHACASRWLVPDA